MENADYLLATFGRKWVEKAVHRGDDHPFISDWRFGGEQAFLRLNTLAEDLRTLQGVPCLLSLVRDLKSRKAFKPALHTIHVAALFARGGNSLSKFFASANDSIPDFETFIADTRTPVEAKQLTQSEPERDFTTAAKVLESEITNALLRNGQNNPEVQVLIKDPRHVPEATAVIEAVQGGLNRYQPESTVTFRSSDFNVRILPSSSSVGMIEHYTVQVIAPRDASEDARVERLLNKANKQLKKNTAGQEPALFCLAIGQHQDPHAVADLISKRFAAGNYRSTSGVIVHRYARHAGPGPISTADMILTIGNPRAHVRCPRVTLKGVGLTGNLIDNTPIDGTTSCYSVAIAMGRPGPTGGFLGLNPMFRIQSDAFA